ncbi:DUF2163 domain-containing protein [Phaeobacter sp. QD34_3]|uniref:DUF2163 domain-containing protein n=1 Tax=unclassified Phaeobacter TaxID=2621772 RepID=UPI00237F6FCB|nr:MULTISPECIES: DUF2163 domain-containing protein [unclassified Phaeobacter]MDE4132111.1 DUF2163 domain-containing protein [Phaeobacter sp. QD34_3]MDE4135749.1 DUF2163 domain-containing protein [Phaeobacter sp. QD34_24]
MAGPSQAFLDHVATGNTSLCRAWALTRADGTFYGFTDHDRDLVFDTMLFKANCGMTARALQQATGLSVDNTEALGALSDAGLREDDIEAGRFDGADVRCWLVNWQDVAVRWLQFRGSIGELRRAGGAFEAELRGLSEGLNRPLGRIYQKPCTAVLGDRSCGFDLDTPGYAAERVVEQSEEGRVFFWSDLAGFEPEWFTRGRLTVLSGAAQGLWSAIKQDRSDASGRRIELWEPLRAAIAAGDLVRLEAGCDKRMETCRLKFNNLLNYRGFPDIPGEDWVMSVPKSTGVNTGGSRR